MADPHGYLQNGDLTVVVEDKIKKDKNESENKEDASNSMDKRRPSNKSNKSVSFEEDAGKGQHQNGLDPDDAKAPVVRSGHFSQNRMSRMSMRSFG